jgi:hypothetical protein
LVQDSATEVGVSARNRKPAVLVGGALIGGGGLAFNLGIDVARSSVGRLITVAHTTPAGF